MATIGGRGWNDKLENYADSYAITANGTTATAVGGQDAVFPCIVYSMTISVNSSIGSGTISLVDGSATADSGDTRNVRLLIASGSSQSYVTHNEYPRGIVFNTGLIVSAATVSGTINLTYKRRYY